MAQLDEVVSSSPIGEFVDLDGDLYYRIAAYHRMAPFLMSIPSDTDLWMFVASGGGLSAGRVDADGSLFPYETVDKLHDAHHHTGPVTVIQVTGEDGASTRWEPFSESSAELPGIQRALYKNTTGNRLVFEETHRELGLSFRYRWSASDEFGWVRTATLENRGQHIVQIRLLDGLRNVLPYGAPLSLYQQSSNLVDAYKKSEVDEESGLGIFSLTASITDRAEALEVLRANTVWCCGLEDFRVHLSLSALDAFRDGKVVSRESVLNGARGNYLVSAGLALRASESASWHIVGDTAKDHVQIAELRHRLLGDEDLTASIETSLWSTRENLRRNVGSADGIQLSRHTAACCHHFANVLFNNMRGGVFLHNYEVLVDDLRDFIRTRNQDVANRQDAALAALPETTTLGELQHLSQGTGDEDFQRLCYEYLPLHFSRRHGDPSRPWNRFSIRVRNQNGERELNYEGNWRDIFQNWEALGQSFPAFLPSMAAKFVNASTVDGFNPYRITRDGVDWEVHEQEDPWSNIGYWGDHQIIYMLKLLESMQRYDPAAIGELLGREIFSYAEVPYRIKPYEEILQDPRLTIEFDIELAEKIDLRVETLGSDGKLLNDRDGSIYHVNFLEKLLVPLLSKLSNLVPDLGIWMNTQRPEWNDANNALGGGGVSVVTLCYLRRHLAFLSEQLGQFQARALPISQELADWFERIAAALADGQVLLLADSLNPRDQKALMDELGGAFSQYRELVYSGGFSGKTPIQLGRVVDLCRGALCFVDHAIAANQRPDGLYHTYHQLVVADDGSSFELVNLPEMLEGQVAVLSSGFLSPAEALQLLQRLFESALYQPGQRSFLLYPERELPGFLAKNLVPEADVEKISLLKDLLMDGEASLLARDADGNCRFQGDLSNSDDVAEVLAALQEQEEWSDAVQRDRAAILDLFEDLFGHRSYTGRSGVMYGYEGLGCIYWHMVAKLLLAVQENCLQAESDGSPASLRDGLTEMYFRVRSGIGYEKTVLEYGAFPTDPYSHTPPVGGARQPGMTGQVKEEILTRTGELGVRVQDGMMAFEPRLLSFSELLEQPEEFHYFDVDGRARVLDLPPQSLAFTFCQVPVVYELAPEDAWIQLTFRDGSSVQIPGNQLDAQMSAELFSRDGRVDRIRVGVPRQNFLQV